MIASLAALFLTLYTANQLCLNVGFGSRLCENSNRAGFWELQNVSRSADRRLWAVLYGRVFTYYRQIRVFTQPRSIVGLECRLPAPRFIHSGTDFAGAAAFVIARCANAAFLQATTTPAAGSLLRVRCRSDRSRERFPRRTARRRAPGSPPPGSSRAAPGRRARRVSGI